MVNSNHALRNSGQVDCPLGAPYLHKYTEVHSFDFSLGTLGFFEFSRNMFI